MKLPPASVAESWPAPNYVNPVTRGYSLLITNVVFLTLCTTAVALRIYVRIGSRFYGWDDTWLVFALIFALALGIETSFAGLQGGWNLHTWDLPQDKFQSAEIYVFVTKLLFLFTMTSSRMRLLIFYYRLIADTGMRVWKATIAVAVVITVLLLVLYVPLVVFNCTPVYAHWTYPPVAHARCLPEGVVDVTYAVINVVHDLVLTLLPVPIVLSLSLPLKQRLGVLVLLCLGMVVTIAGAVKTYYIYQAQVGTYDQSWYSYPLWIWGTIESDLAILCACAPALKTFVARAKTRRVRFDRTKGISRRLTDASASSKTEISNSWMTDLSSLGGPPELVFTAPSETSIGANATAVGCPELAQGIMVEKDVRVVSAPAGEQIVMRITEWTKGDL